MLVRREAMAPEERITEDDGEPGHGIVAAQQGEMSVGELERLCKETSFDPLELHRSKTIHRRGGDTGVIIPPMRSPETVVRAELIVCRTAAAAASHGE
jgi:hypothetical protein